jgi:hypothetical protein
MNYHNDFPIPLEFKLEPSSVNPIRYCGEEDDNRYWKNRYETEKQAWIDDRERYRMLWQAELKKVETLMKDKEDVLKELYAVTEKKNEDADITYKHLAEERGEALNRIIQEKEKYRNSARAWKRFAHRS